MPDALKEGSDADSSNVWKSLLGQYSSTSSLPPVSGSGTLVVVGDNASAIQTLLCEFRGICMPIHPFNYGVSYANVDTSQFIKSDPGAIDIPYFEMDIWHANDSAFGGLLSSLLTKKDAGSMVMSIVLDLTEPTAAVDSLERWLPFIGSTMESINSSRTTEEVEQLKHQLSIHVQCYVEPKRRRGSIGTLNAVDASIPLLNFGIPLVIVGARAERIVDSSNVEKWGDEAIDALLCYIRRKALDYGAAVMCHSTSSASKPETMPLLQAYAMHRMGCFLPPGASDMTPRLLDGEDGDEFFIPSGFDSEALISASAPCPLETHDVQRLFPIDDPKQLESFDLTEPPSDQEFLASIKEQLDDMLRKVARSPTRRPCAQAPSTPVAPATVEFTLQSPSSNSVLANAQSPQITKKNQAAVKSFFESLLSDHSSSTSNRDVREEAMLALESIKRDRRTAH